LKVHLFITLTFTYLFIYLLPSAVR